MNQTSLNCDKNMTFTCVIISSYFQLMNLFQLLEQIIFWFSFVSNLSTAPRLVNPNPRAVHAKNSTIHCSVVLGGNLISIQTLNLIWVSREKVSVVSYCYQQRLFIEKHLLTKSYLFEHFWILAHMSRALARIAGSVWTYSQGKLMYTYPETEEN